MHQSVAKCYRGQIVPGQIDCCSNAPEAAEGRLEFLESKEFCSFAAPVIPGSESQKVSKR